MRTILLQHGEKEQAGEIHALFQSSYGVEAELIGSRDFPPLRRSISQIKDSASLFLGIRVGPKLVAVAELDAPGKRQPSIHSLVVDPGYFRQGIGRRLLRSVLAFLVAGNSAAERVEVSTAAANHPALKLYESQGFVVARRWRGGNRIARVSLVLTLRPETLKWADESLE